MRFYVSSRAKVGLALVGGSLVSLGLYAVGAISNDGLDMVYLNWNLLLAWLPLLFALWLERVLSRKLWSSWQALVLTLVWLAFLPNSFYMITDFIHLQQGPRVDLLFDVVMLTSFVFNAVILGFLSLIVVHQELNKRFGKQWPLAIVMGILLLSSFAIYVGRDLRWSTWDVLVNPASILFDVSDRVFNPAAHPQVFTTTVSFFVLLSSTYVIIYQLARRLRPQKTHS